MLTLLGLAAATLVSEDAACVTAAVLIANGTIGAVPAIVACTAGIFIGDLGLWGLGRSGSAGVARIAWARTLLERARRHDAARLLTRSAASAIVSSRFLPGTRLPLYVGAGLIGVRFTTFAGWSLFACCLWTPAVVLAAGQLGGAVNALGSDGGQTSAWWQAGGALLVLPVIGFVRLAADTSWHRRVGATVARWCRWEFWPMWLFYPPVALWLLWLSVRYRGVTTVTAANPGMPDGGTVGESKFDILASLPADAVIPSFRLAPGDLVRRVASMRQAMLDRGWDFPLVVKPDVGQRGTGVRMVRRWDQCEAYLRAMPGAILVQPYDPGPFEAGVFYVRQPECDRGRVFSITDKVFPEVFGDGVATVEALIWRHPRFRMQAATFLRRLGDRAAGVPARGERVSLALAGNHAQGTLFRDGGHLLTDALESRIDEIARTVPGFFIGRFDIRYRSVDEFRQGRAFAIVELNGATAESTNIYAPGASLLSAYRTLFTQWSLVFSIGAANRQRGYPTTPARRLLALVWAHLTSPNPIPLSD